MDLFEGSHESFNGRHARDIPGESSALSEEARWDSDRRERFAHPVADGCQLELLAGHLVVQLVGRRLLALRPQLTQKGAGLAAREPGVAEPLPQVGAQL